jgi:hypothetical protein
MTRKCFGRSCTAEDDADGEQLAAIHPAACTLPHRSSAEPIVATCDDEPATMTVEKRCAN